MTNKHYAIYGNITLKRQWCSKCKGYAFVKKSRLSCCDSVVGEFVTHEKKVISEPRKTRTPLSKKEKEEILKRQDHKCLYCELPFGEPIWSKRLKRVIFLKLIWDHFVPYSFSFNNFKTNYVAACHICNSIKSNKIFDSIEEARNYVIPRRRKKYTTYTDSLSL